jgi:anti-sigma-K factor RskA
MLLFILLQHARAVQNELELQMAEEDCRMLVQECRGPCWQFVAYYEDGERCLTRPIANCTANFTETAYCRRCHRRRLEDVDTGLGNELWFRTVVCLAIVVVVATLAVKLFNDRKRSEQKLIRSVALNF